MLRVPSGNAFVGEIANMVGGVMSCPILPSNFIRKKHLGELVVEYEGGIPNLPPRLNAAYKEQMGVWRKANSHDRIAMKNVNVGIRKYIKPMTLDCGSLNLKGKHVLIIDDLMASGSSISSAAEIITKLGGQRGN